MHLMLFSEFCESPPMHWTSSTIYNLQSITYTLRSTIYNLQSTLYTLHSTIYNLHSTIYTVLCLFAVVSMTESDPHMILIKYQ